MVFQNWPIKEMNKRQKTDANNLSKVEFTGQLVAVRKYKLITITSLHALLANPLLDYLLITYYCIKFLPIHNFA